MTNLFKNVLFTGFCAYKTSSFLFPPKGAGVKNAYGPSIILFTILIRILIFPLSYQQIASTQMTQALNPKVQEIKEKYADNKDLQNQMTALLYQETKVTD